MLFNFQVPGQRVSHPTPAKAGDCDTPGHPRHEWDGKAEEKPHPLRAAEVHFEVYQVVVNTYFMSSLSHPTWISALQLPWLCQVHSWTLKHFQTWKRTKIHTPFVVSVSEGMCGVTPTLVQAAPLRWMSSLMLLFSLLSLQ